MVTIRSRKTGTRTNAVHEKVLENRDRGYETESPNGKWPLWRRTLAIASIFGIVCYCLAVPLSGKWPHQAPRLQRSPSSVPMSRRHKDILECSGPYTSLIPTNSNYVRLNFTEGPYELSQVVILQRHTARYPVEKSYHRIMRALRKIQRLPDPAVSLDVYLEKLQAWQMDGKLGQLTDNGREMAYRFGQVYAERYPAFTRQDMGDEVRQPFVRSSGSPRVVESGGYIINALRGEPFTLSTKNPIPLPDVVFPTGTLSQGHNPIGEKGCQLGKSKQYQRDGTRRSKRYLDSFSDFVLPHLESTLGCRGGHKLDPIDAAALMSLCAYTSQEEPSNTAEHSPSMWCDLFKSLGEETEVDIWRRYAYWYDVTKWYVKGQGNPANRNAGVGWVNELVARLTDSAVSRFTDTNQTLDTDATTFPRGGRRMFIDLSHDNRMLSVLTALGVLHRDSPLPEDYDPLIKSGYAQGELSPFGMNVIVERYSPASIDQVDDQASKPDLIRLMLNDVPITPAQVAHSNRFGSLMTVEEFIKSQAWALAGGEWTEYCAEELPLSEISEDGDQDALSVSDSSG